MTHKLTRLTATVLAVIMAFSVLLVPVSAASFTDVSDSAWYKAAVDYVYERGWMTGTSQTSFAPNAEVTRGMMVTVLARVAEAETNNETVAFTDTASGKWYTGAAAWAAENGIVAGVGSGCFAPNRAITRQDLCVMLYKYISLMGYELKNDIDRTFTDMGSVSDYAREAVIYCTGTGLVSGFEDSSFRPKTTATRAQVAQIMMRLDLLLNDEPAPTEPMPAQSFDGTVGKEMKVFVNAPEGALPEKTDMVLSQVSDRALLTSIQERAGGQILAVADISFAKNGEELEPEKAVEVQIGIDGLELYEHPTVVHVRGDGTVEIVDAELVSATRGGGKVLSFTAKDFSVYAVVDSDTNNDSSRLVVKIWKRNIYNTGFEIDKKVLVTRQDVERLATIIPDGETPTVFGKEIFCGWYVDAEAFGTVVGETETAEYAETRYTIGDVDGQHTMDAARDEIKDLLEDPSFVIRDSETAVNIYPIIYNYFVVSLVDENGETTFDTTIIYTKEATASYVPQLVYSPYLAGYRFLGWQKDDGDPTVYENGDTAPLTEQTTVFRAQVQRGYWLTFNENPDGQHKGATYNGPRFCVDGVVTNEQHPEDPTLAGYTFAGWYTDSTFQNPFNFTGTIAGDTMLYAKWTADPTAKVTVILWRQTVDDDWDEADANKTYDYYRSFTFSATPGTAISALNLSQYYTINSASELTIDGTTYAMDGFEFNTTRGVTSKDNNVAQSGNTVVNVYFNRKVVHIYFKYPTAPWTSVAANNLNTTNTQQYYFAKEDNNYYPVRDYNSSNVYYLFTGTLNTSNTYYVVTGGYYRTMTYSYGTGWTFNDGSSTQNLSDHPELLVYGRVPRTSSYTVYLPTWGNYNTFTGLAGQRPSEKNLVWPTAYRWFDDIRYYATNATYYTRLDQFDVEDITLYGYPQTFNTHTYHYQMDVYGNWPSSPTETSNTVITDGTVFFTYAGFSPYRFRLALPEGVTTYYTSSSLNDTGDGLSDDKEEHDAIDGWTDWLTRPVYIDYTGNTRWENTRWTIQEGGMEFMYTRRQYKITYNVGKYEDDAGNSITGPVNGLLKQSPSIYYQASITSYGKNGADYYNPEDDLGTDEFVFAGWYKDTDCTEPYTFNKMPLNGITLYAKFVQKEYRVFVHSNIPESLEGHAFWPDGEKTNMKLDYLEQVSNGNPIVIMDDRGEGSEWVLVGWFTDPEFENQFNFETKLTDDTTVPYNMSEVTDYGPYTSEDGNTIIASGVGYNKDAVENRYWVNGKLDLYAKWRRVLSGANGIKVNYDAYESNEETGLFTEFDPAQRYYSDPLAYTDQAHVIARSASTPNDSGEAFLYWQILDNQGNPYTLIDGSLDPAKLVYPGQDFVVSAADAVEDAIQNPVTEHQHNWVHYEEKAPTCLDGNWDHWYCTYCGQYVWSTDNSHTAPDLNNPTTYAATNRPGTGAHNYGEWVTNNDGTHIKTCSRCGHIMTEACTFVDTVTPPTEESMGFTTHTCSVCGYSYVDTYVPAILVYYTVTTLAEGGGTIDPESAQVQRNGSVSFNAAANANYVVGNVSLTPSTAATVNVNGPHITLSNVTADCRLTVTFEPAAVYTVTYSANGTVLDTEEVPQGSTVTLPATVPEVTGNSFLGWVDATVAETTAAPAYYAPGASSGAITSNKTFYALYTYSVTENTEVYKLLTAAPATWIDDFVITYLSTSSLLALKGLNGDTSYESSSVGGTVAYASTGMTLDSLDGTPILKNVSSDYIFHITEGSSGKYKLQNAATGAYLSSYGSPAALTALESYSAAYGDWTLQYDTTYHSVKASNAFSSSYPYLAKASSNAYFTVNDQSKYQSNPPQFWQKATELVTTDYFSTTAEEIALCDVTAVPNNGSYGTVTPGSATVTSGGTVTFTAAPADGYVYASTAYTVSPSGAAAVSQNGDVFTVVPTASCTVTINFEALPTYTVTFMANGAQYGSAQTVIQGRTVTLPSTATGVENARFLGWVTSSYAPNTAQPATVYEPGATSPAITANTTFYALYSYSVGGSGVRYSPVNAIETGKNYLIGYKNGSNVYLIMNYNPDGSGNSYYANNNGNWYAWGVQAEMDGNDVVGVYTDVYANALLEYAEWQFVANSSTYQIRSVHNASYYLKVYTSSTSYNDCFATNDSSYNKWAYNTSTHRLSYAVDSSTTRYLTYVATHGSYSNVFSAPTSYNSTTSTLQLYSETTEAGTTYYSTTVQGTQRYTVTAAANNSSYGTVSVSGSPVTDGGSATVTAAPNPGYTYASPAYTVTSGTAVVTQSGNTFTVTPSSSCDITINFEPLPNYTVTYNANGGTGTMTEQTGYQGSSVTIQDNGFTYTGKTFAGWNTAADGSGTAYDAGDSYTLTANLTLYAQWDQGVEKWVPTDVINTDEDYLIGYKVNASTVILLTNSTSHYDTSALGANSYYAYGVQAVVDGDYVTNVTGSFNSQTATMEDVLWRFSTVSGGYKISNPNASGTANLTVDYASTNNYDYEDLYVKNETTAAKITFTWDASTHYLVCNGRYVTFRTALGNYFGAVKTADTTYSRIQLYHKELVSTTHYTVSYSANGSVIGTADVESGHTTTLPGSATAVTGYTFVGWAEAAVANTTTAPSCYAPGATSPAITGNKTFYAVYTREVQNGRSFTRLSSAPSNWAGNYVITYGSDASMLMKGLPDTGSYENIVNHGAVALVNTGASVSGSTLTGVSDQFTFAMESAGSGSYTFRNLATNVYLARYATTSDAYLYALSSSYTSYATFNKWSVSMESGGNAILTNSTPNGYTASYPCLGYNTTEKVFWVISESSAADIYLWKENESTTLSYTTNPSAGMGYTVSFSVPSGVGAVSALTVTPGDGIILPAADSLTGWLFMGWSETDLTDVTAAGSFLSDGALYTPSGNMELKAVYGYEDEYYQRLSAAPSNYSGYYVITSGYTSSDYMLNSLSGTYTSNTSGRTLMNSVTLSNNNTEMRGVSSNNRVWIDYALTNSTQYLYIENNDDVLLQCDSSGSLTASTSSLSQYYQTWTHSYSGGRFLLTNGYYTDYSLGYNSTYYWSGLSSTSGVYLWQRHAVMHYSTAPNSGSSTVYYNKVTSSSALTAGTYLIVSEDDNLAFNGSLGTLDASGNGTAVTISGNAIEATSAVDAISFTLAQSGSSWTIKSASGYYIGRTATSNGMNTSTTNAYTNSISISSGNAVITSNGLYLRYYYATGTGGQRYRYYTNSGTGRNIQLYKRDTALTSAVTEPMDFSEMKDLRSLDETRLTRPEAEHEKSAEEFETAAADAVENPVEVEIRAVDIQPVVGDVVIYRLATSIETGKTYLIVWGDANVAANGSNWAVMNSYSVSGGSSGSRYLEAGTPIFKTGSNNSIITGVNVSTGSISDCEWTVSTGSENGTYNFVCDGYYLYQNLADDYNLQAWNVLSTVSPYHNWNVVKSTASGAEFFNIHNYYWHTRNTNRYYYLYYRSGDSYGFTNYYNTDAPGTYAGYYRMFLYEKVTKTTATITFNPGFATDQEATTQTVTIGQNATLNTNPFNRDGYRFTGWNTIANGSGTAYAADATVNLSDDLTLYAQWQKTWNVNFVDSYESSNNFTLVVDNNTAIPSGSVPNPNDTSSAWNHEDEYYYFTGWNREFSGLITGDMTVTALYEFRREGFFTVTFRDWNGQIIQVNGQDSQQVQEGKNAIAPPIPTRAGFVFKSWDKDLRDVHQNMTVYATYASMVTKTYTVQVKAVYGPMIPLEETHVTWYANNDTGYYMNSAETVINGSIDIETPATFDYEQDAPETPGDLVRPGYTFMGWARMPEYSSMVVENVGSREYTTESGEADPVLGSRILQYNDLTADDLWLVYNQPDKDHPNPYYTVREEGSFLNGGATFSHIAANENDPYHGLYAVWQRSVFYVMHSSNGTIEAVGMPADNENGTEVAGLDFKVGTFDLSSLVRSGYLYGGYYSVYGGANDEEVTKAAHSFSYRKLGGWETSAEFSSNSQVEAAHPYITEGEGAWSSEYLFDLNTYNGQYVYANNSNTPMFVYENGQIVIEDGKPVYQYPKFWTAANAGTALNPGDAFTPEVGEVYYLKEVPNTYLRSRYFYVNNNTATANDEENPGPITKLYLLSYVDDNNYSQVGFKYVNNSSLLLAQNAAVTSGEVLANSFTLSTMIEGAYSQVTIDYRAFGGPNNGLQRGLVSAKDLSSLIAADAKITMIPSWVTYDGVTVTQDPMSFTMNNVDGVATKIEEFTRSFPLEIYINYTWESDYWLSNGAIIRGCFVPASGEAVWVRFQQVTGTIMRAEVPEGNYQTLVITRADPENDPGENGWGQYWNRTLDIRLVPGMNYLQTFDAYGDGNQFSSYAVDGNWGVYIP